MDRLDGQVAIVSGSTSGIGEQVARDLAEAGAHVVVNSSSSVEAGVALAKALPTESIYVQADISQEEDDQALVAAAVAKFGRLDILVNNAGWTTRVPHTDLDALSNDILFKTFEINVYGTWWLNPGRYASSAECRTRLYRQCLIGGWGAGHREFYRLRHGEGGDE